MQKIHMMRAKPREEDQNINIVMRSDIEIGANKGKQPGEAIWIHNATEKEVDFDLNHAKEMFLEEKKNFAKASTSRSREKLLETNVTPEGSLSAYSVTRGKAKGSTMDVDDNAPRSGGPNNGEVGQRGTVGSNTKHCQSWSIIG